MKVAKAGLAIMNLSTRSTWIVPSPTLSINGRARFDVIDFSAGELDKTLLIH